PRSLCSLTPLHTSSHCTLSLHDALPILYFTTHGRDWLGEDVPNDRFDHAPRKGLHFGYPYCHQGDIPDPEYGKGRSCGEFAPPLDRKSTRLNSSHQIISYAVFCLKKKNK